jgi:hypothetical protein
MVPVDEEGKPQALKSSPDVTKAAERRVRRVPQRIN